MKLNWVEFLAMNNPLRRAVQRRFEVPRLLRMGGPLDGGTVLEVGCGNGAGIECLLSTFKASHVDAFDLDERMVKRAQQRTAHLGDVVSIWQGDACSIPKPGAVYDAVFDFGVLHHVLDWRQALGEIHRVLKPHGRFYADEVFGNLTNRFPWRQLLDHPREDRFDAAQFVEGLERAGFTVLETNSLWKSFGWFLAEKREG